MAKSGLLGNLGQILGQMNTDPLAALGMGGGQARPGPNGMPVSATNPIIDPDLQEGDITIRGDGWKPHKPTILGALADAYLMSRGQKAAFADARDQQNEVEAMQGLTQNPKQVIDRMSRIRGHSSDAWKMYNEYADNTRQQGNLDRQNNIFDMKKEELVYGRVASMMGAANESTWGKMRDLAKMTADKYGVDITDLVPETYDPDSIEYIRSGAIKPKDQERIAQSDRRLDQADTRIGETGRHNRTTEGQAATNEAGRNDRHDHPVARPTASAAKPMMTKYGVMVPNKDGTKGILRRNGKTYGYVKVNDKWVPVGEVNIK